MNTHEKATRLIQMICEEYGITMSDLKKEGLNIPRKVLIKDTYQFAQ